MTWYPIAFLPPQYQDTSGNNYSGAVLKAYAANTTTPISMATDSTGATLASGFALNAGGYPVSGGAIIIPHVQVDYRLVLFPSQAAADANDTGSAIFNIPEIKIAEVSSEAFVQTFSGDGTTTGFTLSEDLGDNENTIMVFADKKFGEYTTNGTFDADSNWTKGSGWTIGSGVATASGAISTDLTQSAAIPLIQGHSYTITYTITRSAGGVIPKVGGTSGTERTSSGTYTETIIAGSTQAITFSGNGFTGTVDNVSVHRTTASRREILRPDEFTLDGVDLDFDEAPAAGTSNILVFAPSLLFGAVGSLADAAATSETNAAASADLAEEWASKTDGIVDATDYSSKAYAIGGTGVTNTAAKGAAKEWATTTGGTVDTNDYSAKEYAAGTTVPTGSAKQWANEVEDTEVTSGLYSSLHYAAKAEGFKDQTEAFKNTAQAAALAAASAATEGLYNNVVTLTNADSPYVPDILEEGTLYRLDCTSGNIVVNLSTLATYGEDMKFSFAKVDNSVNTGTVNAGGADTINGGASVTLSDQNIFYDLVGDSATGTWLNRVNSTSVTANNVSYDNSGSGLVAATVQDAIDELDSTLDGLGALAGKDTVATGDVDNDAITNAKMANMATQTIKGRTTGGTGDPEDLTATQATAILNAVVGDSGSGGTKGLVPAPAAGDAAAGKFLKADGTWTAPPPGLTSVSQGDLNTSTGTISLSVTTTGSGAGASTGTSVALPGGQYGFFPESRSTSYGGSGATIIGPYRTTGSYANHLAQFAVHTSGTGGSGSSQHQQRYITSSPPFDMGDGEAAGFMFLLLDNDGNVIQHYFADVPPWGYNGPTDIRATHINTITGEKYRTVKKPMTIEEILDGAEVEYIIEEITQEIKNRDMAILPTPFDLIPEGFHVTMIDPMDDKIRKLIELQNSGGGDEVVDALFSGKLFTRDEPLRRAGPQGVKITPLYFK